MMWVDLIQIVEGLSVIKADLPEQEGILPADCLCIPSWVFGLPCRFWTYQSFAIAWTHIHTHTLLDLFLWITLANTEVFLTTKLYTEIAQSELLNHRG